SNLGYTDICGCPNVERERTDWGAHRVPPGSASLHRKANCPRHELREPGRHRHRERAIAERTAPENRAGRETKRASGTARRRPSRRNRADEPSETLSAPASG